MTVKDAERGTRGAPRSGPCSLTAVRAEATTVKITSKRAHLYIASLRVYQPTPADWSSLRRNAEQLREDVKYRRKWCEKIGLGFVLPANVSQLSQPKPNAAARKKAA